MTSCGIPSNHLQGNLQDWEKLLQKTREISEKFVELHWWFKRLNVCFIVENFYEAAKGNIILPFWKDIYTYGSVSGGAKINGFIVRRLIPYLKDGYKNHCLDNPLPLFDILSENNNNNLNNNNDDNNDDNDYEELEELDGTMDLWHGITPSKLPMGISCAPFVWDYLGKEFNYQFLSGFMGTSISIDEEGKSALLKPLMGWAVRPSPLE